ncbi:acyl-CoA thioesterase [Halomicrobium urmianum]|uniref:acyl-CoA thioesterase n=1 Tax=Halomicrobium urmianum TaxID=1586233 RepID=UPI001CD94215|nr:thioesterase family protein [Halomicrobium urmianum]
MTFETTVDVRFTDVDTYGHVNNAVYATYMEEARIAYLEAVLGDEAADLLSPAADGTGLVMAGLELDFERPLRTVDAVTVTVETTALGRSSVTIEYELRDEAVVATGETTLVAYDRAAAESRPLPDRWREAIVEFEGLDAE